MLASCSADSFDGVRLWVRVKVLLVAELKLTRAKAHLLHRAGQALVLDSANDREAGWISRICLPNMQSLPSDVVGLILHFITN